MAWANLLARGCLVATFSSVLAACGGGGGGDAPAPSEKVQADVVEAAAQGVYAGTLSGTTSSNAFQMILLENGDFWALYGSDTNATLYISGFIQGNGTARNGSFSSSNAKDFGFSPAVAGTVSATYATATHTINGSFSVPGSTVSFSGGSPPDSLYDYSTAASLSTISGNWSLKEVGGPAITLNIEANGALSATSQGCAITGRVSPRPSGKNVFDVSLAFGPSPCVLANQTASGIAVPSPLPNGKTQLLVAVVDGSRSRGIVAFGQR